MSPEQARGKPVDKRADIFAFGAILYEMLTGEKAFPAETVGDALAAVLTKEPDLGKAPAEVRTLLRLCLQKDPKVRLHDAGDAMALWDAAASAPRRAGSDAREKYRWWPVLAGAFFVASAVFAFLYSRKPDERPPELMRFESSLPPRVAFASPGVLSISPDGRKVVFPAIGVDGGRHLWIRSLDEVDAKPFEETSIPADRPLFWSPDSRFVVYADTDEKRLKKLEVSTAAIDDICQIPDDAFGGTWNREDLILFGSRKGIVRVPASGGTPSLVTAVDPSRPELHSNPVFLPDGKRFLYNRNSTKEEVAGLYWGDVGTQPSQQSTVRVAPITFGVRYVSGATGAGGELLYMSTQTELVSQLFDSSTLKLSGEPVTVAQQLGASPELATGLFSVSDTGVLVYRRDIPRDLQLTLFDRGGALLRTAGNPARYGLLVLSPDGTKIAATESDPVGRTTDIWVMDTATGASNRLTFGQGVNTTPVWSPDSTRIAYEAIRKGKVGVFIKSANGSGVEELVREFPQAVTLTEWTDDGKYLIYTAPPPAAHIWAVPLTGDRKPFPVIQSESSELAGHVSPDGRYIVYMSNETGHREIYVQPFPPGPAAGKWIISRGTLGMPRWRSDGREIYYLAQDGWIMAVPVERGPVFHGGPPQQLFQTPPVFLRAALNPGTLADVSRDGKRFLIAMPPGGAREDFTVVLNWQWAKKK
jgi:Tol biopolymer transport system component